MGHSNGPPLGRESRSWREKAALRGLLPILITLPALGPIHHAAAADAPPASEPVSIEVRIPPDADPQATPIDALRKWQAWLTDSGFSPTRCGADLEARTLALDTVKKDDIRRLTRAGFKIVGRSQRTPLNQNARGTSAYFDPAEVEAMLAQVELDHPFIARRFAVGTTIEGRTIWAIEISDNPGIDEDEPAVQFNGQHHAREVVTSHVVMDIVDLLTDGYGADPAITGWVDDYKTICVPMVNPDGVQYVFDADVNWRKNRRPNTGCSPSCNGTGVDNNRNYPYLWGPGCGSSGCCSNNAFRGPSSASEDETQAMRDLADAFHFVMATSYHAFGRFIDYPYACSDGTPATLMPEHDVIDEMMSGMAAAICAVDGVAYTAFTPVPFGPVNGDDTSWYYAHKGTYPFIVEVGTSFQPLVSDVPAIINRNRAGWQFLYDRLGRARIDVHVTVDCQPAEAEVTLTDFVFDTGELPRQTFLPFGRWTFLVPPDNDYTVRISKPGFVTRDVAVYVVDLPISVDVQLEPLVPDPASLPGDMNADCIVNGLDVAPFVDALLNGPAAPLPQILRGDFDDSCVVDLPDVAPFIAAALNADACP